MTILGWVAKKISKRTSKPYDLIYESFHESYKSSYHKQLAHTLQTVLWVIASILSGYLAYRTGDATKLLPTLTFVIIALLGVLFVFPIFPYIHWRYAKPFNFIPKWFPLTQDPKALQQAHYDKLRLPDEDSYRIVVFFDIPGHIEEYDFKLISSHEELEFEVFPEKQGMSQTIYPDDKGIYSSTEINNDNVFNIYTVQKRSPFGGDPSHFLEILEVSNISGLARGDSGYNLDEEIAREEGTNILHIDVDE
ncbi:hypothetical protein A4G99_03700 [Haladaptatus sp. R4]|uniref:hypothetical protein n=1 Tax=Haladaptatus sp. R4 TaxID=1679489 RepID=UPI0007B4C3A2|nr:hypothetical protein [Haladaptatus sp. R4]KZN25584.1 hypothetical protein A4G99_03700 [Haladaptatus sp. R4]